MRLVLALSALMSAPCAAAAATMTVTHSAELAFVGERFYDVTDDEGFDIPVVTDGASFGLTGTFSHLAPGDRIAAHLTFDYVDRSYLTVTECTFGSLSCLPFYEDIDHAADLSRVEILTEFFETFDLDYGRRRAEYVDDSGMGEGYLLYAADFDIVADETSAVLATVPVPWSAALLLAGVGGLGMVRRRA